VGDFTSSGCFGVGTVYGVLVDGYSEVGTDGTCSGFFRVGGTHQLTVLGNGVFAFQHLNDDRAGGHEGNQVLEEATLAVLGVEASSFALGQLNHLGSDDAQAGLLETGGDFADDVLGDSVGLDDGEGTLQGHVKLQIGGFKANKSTRELYAGLELKDRCGLCLGDERRRAELRLLPAVHAYSTSSIQAA